MKIVKCSTSEQEEEGIYEKIGERMERNGGEGEQERQRTFPHDEHVLLSPGVDAPHEGQEVWPGIVCRSFLSGSLIAYHFSVTLSHTHTLSLISLRLLEIFNLDLLVSVPLQVSFKSGS